MIIESENYNDIHDITIAINVSDWKLLHFLNDCKIELFDLLIYIIFTYLATIGIVNTGLFVIRRIVVKYIINDSNKKKKCQMNHGFNN